MTLLVVGATGQLARELARLPSPPTPMRFVDRTQLDLSEPKEAAAIVRALRPAAVLNAAAYTAVDRAEEEEDLAMRVNAHGPAAIATVCADLGIPFVHVSTDYVFDGSKPSPYYETDPVAPLGAYGRSKLAGEIAVSAAGGRSALVRTAWVFSPFGANFVKTMLRLAQTRPALAVVADQQGRPTHAADLARACLMLMAKLLDKESNAEGLFHFAGADDAVWADVAEAVFEASRPLGGPVAEVTRITSAEYVTAARRPANSRLASDKLQVLGAVSQLWRPRVAECVAEVLRS